MELPAALFEDVTGCAPPAAEATAPGASEAGAPVPPSERRGAERFYLSRRALVAPVNGKKVETPRMAMLRDVSRTGVGLLHDRKVKPGQELIVYLPRKHESRPVPVRCAVAYCERSGPKDGPYLVGASFLAVLDPDYAPPNDAGQVPTPQDISEEVKRIQQVMFT